MNQLLTHHEYWTSGIISFNFPFVGIDRNLNTAHEGVNVCCVQTAKEIPSTGPVSYMRSRPKLLFYQLLNATHS
jgi:hypothetical protein